MPAGTQVEHGEITASLQSSRRSRGACTLPPRAVRTQSPPPLGVLRQRGAERIASAARGDHIDLEGQMSTTQDPYGAPPQATGGASGPRAGFWKRFGASFIDGLILAVPYLIIAFAVHPLLGYAVYLLAGIAYFTYFEGGPKGQTLGKQALGIRVIDLATGGPIGFGRGFIRYIGRIVSAIVIYLGYLWMLWDPEKQTWHDKMAGCVVVPTASYPVS